MKTMGILVSTLLLGGCVASDQSFQTAGQLPATAPALRQAPPNTQAPANIQGAAAAATPQPAQTGLIAGLDRWGRDFAAVVRGEGGTVPASTSVANPALPAAQAAAEPAPPRRQGRRLATVQSDATPGETGSVPGVSAASAAVAYEKAMLRRDPRSMARAAARLTNKPISESSIRDLNAQLGIEADEATVAAVVRAAR